jgi:hypothetical protein
MLIVLVNASRESTYEAKGACPLLQPKALLFQGPYVALCVRAALGVVVTGEGLKE